MEEGISITDHIDIFNKIILDLQDLNVKIDDEDKAMNLLCSLSSSYEHLIVTYGRQTLTVVVVKEPLGSETAIKQESKDWQGLTTKERSEKNDGNRVKEKRSKSK